MINNVPYIKSERNHNVIECNADLAVIDDGKIVLMSLLDYAIKIKKIFSDLIQGKGVITLFNRADIFYENNLRTYDQSYRYKLNKHDEKTTHGVIYNTDKDNYLFDWKNEGLNKSLTKYLSNNHYLPITEDIVAQTLKLDKEWNTIINECEVMTTQRSLQELKVWRVNVTAFKQQLEKVNFHNDEDFDWNEVENTTDYLVKFINPIMKKINNNIKVLYNPNEVSEKIFDGITPMEGQIPLIQGGIETLKQKNSRFLYLAAEQGSGKSIMGSKINHVYHCDKGKTNYITLLVAPAITLTQWKEELKKSIADDIDVKIIKNTNEFIRFHKATNMKVAKPTYILVGKETFKLSYQVKHGVISKKREVTIQEENRFGWKEDKKKTIEVCLCPDCGKPLINPLRKNQTIYFTENDFKKPKKSNYKCSNCDSVLFQSVYNKNKKTSIIEYVKKKNIRFHSVIIDEIHESNNFSSIIGMAARDIMQHADKNILLSGTVSNGYASSIFNIMFALLPNTLKIDGVFDKDKFVKLYGTMVGRADVKDSDYYATSRTTVRDSDMQEIEGINPLVFTKYMASNFIFSELDDLKDDLPKLIERYIEIEQMDEIEHGEKELRNDIEKSNSYNASFYNDSIIKHYTNNPFRWSSIPFVFKEGSEKMDTYVQPRNMEEQILPKENKLIKLCKQIVDSGEKAWLYLDFTSNGKYTDGEHLQARLERILKENGLKVYVLKASVKTIERREIIEKNRDKYDVFISHPKLISVGVNLQWCTNYIFYTPSYHVNTVRQAMKRGRRINSTKNNYVWHLYYNSGVEAEIMERFKLKYVEAQALENKFTEVDVKRTASSLGAKIEKELANVV